MRPSTVFKTSRKEVPSIHPLSLLTYRFLTWEGPSTISEGTVDPKDSCGVRANKCVSTHIEIYCFIKLSQQLCAVGVAPILQIRKTLKEVKWPDRMEDPSIPKLFCFNSNSSAVLTSLRLILSEISIREKTEETLKECLQRSEVINLTHLQKEVEGWQMTESKVWTFGFAKGCKRSSSRLRRFESHVHPFVYRGTLNKTLSPPLLHLLICKLKWGTTPTYRVTVVVRVNRRILAYPGYGALEALQQC